MNVKLSEDLTLVLIRANGTPRTFNLPVPCLKRNIVLVAGIFALLLICSLVFSSLYVYDNYIAEKPPLLTEADAEKLQSINGLMTEISKLQANLANKKDLTKFPSGSTGFKYPLQLLGPLSVQADNPPVKIEEPKVIRNDQSKNVRLQFNIINDSPTDTRVRGYIIVLAKTPNGVRIYPEGAFSPSENILLTYNNGETFGISRFRSSEATFSNVEGELKDMGFHILLFSYSGEILNSMHVPGMKI